MAQRRTRTTKPETSGWDDENTAGAEAGAEADSRSSASGTPGTPMDPSAAESPSSPGFQMAERAAYALVTLTEEIETTFEGTTVEYGDRNGWGVALSATYTLPEKKAEVLATLLRHDERVDHTTANSDASFTVSLIPIPHSQDSREPFGLAEAYAVLTESDGTDEPEPEK